MNNVILHIRSALENERTPFYMEPALSALHSLRSSDGDIGLELGVANGKIAFFVRASKMAAQIAESQLYAQYPNIEIDRLQEDPFALQPGEEVVSCDLVLGNPEVFPFRRHPQFDDLLSRLNVDSIAGITSALARYPVPGMRAHMQVCIRPLSGSFRQRALRFLPLLQRGLPSIFTAYAIFLTRLHLARGWKRAVFAPLAFVLGGYKTLPFFRTFVKTAMGTSDVSGDDPAELERASARSHDREDAVTGALDKINRLLYLCNVRISVIAAKADREDALVKLREIVGSFHQFDQPNSNNFVMGPVRTTAALPVGIASRPYILSVEEVATLWHLPTIHVQTPNIDWVLSKKLEPPLTLPLIHADKDDAELTVLGQSIFRGQRLTFGIRRDDRRRHIYALGKTGMGKSTLLENMVFSDIASGRGIGVIDPHGDLIEACLRFIPPERSNDVILFDPADLDFPISFNVLDCPNPKQRVLTASGIMSVFTKLWPDVWSGRMEHILRNTLLALLEYDGATMLGVIRMYTDDAYRAKVVSRVTDPVVKSFWESEYASWTEKYRTEAIAAIQNKVGQLLSTPLIRNIVGQVRSTFDVRHAMDSGKIVLMNLSKGKLGEDTSAFLGSMLVTKFQIEAMSRADIPEAERRDFYLYVDEFQNFATPSFANILSEARKYRLSLTMANQYVGQLVLDGNTGLRDAVFGNVGTLVSFQVGSDDAEVLSLQYEEMVTPKDILSLPKYHAYCRLMIDGMPSKPFSISTLAPPKPIADEARIEVIRRLSRQRYTEKRDSVEEKIRSWSVQTSVAKKSSVQAAKAQEKESEEKEKARKKGMKLEEYRAWRDREMWSNDFNALRKKKLLEEGEWTTADEELLVDLQKKLEAGGGVPPISKGVQELIDKRAKKA